MGGLSPPPPLPGRGGPPPLPGMGGPPPLPGMMGAPAAAPGKPKKPSVKPPVPMRGLFWTKVNPPSPTPSLTP